MRFRLDLVHVLVFLATAGATLAATPAEMLRAIQEDTLDPSACYRVRDLSFAREDVRVYLNEGYLIFAKSVEGRRTGAFFSSDVDGGDAEVIVLPPTRSERQSLARFTSSANLDEHIRAGYFVLPDGTADELLQQLERGDAAKKSPEMGTLLAAKWSPAVAKIHFPLGLRLLQEVLAPAKPGAGLALLAVNGKTYGNFDIVVESRGATRVEVRREAEHDGKLNYEIWTSFPARKARLAAAAPPPPEYTITNYRIDASLANDLHMTAKTGATLHVGATALSTVGMGIAKDMRVAAVRLDGKPVEFLRGDTEKGQLPTDDQESVLLLLPSAPLAAGSEHILEFEHEGNVVKQAGDGVFFVADRESWYPRGGGTPGATYDVTFRYPKRVTLVQAGELVSDKTEGDWRTTHRHIGIPVGAAGFNIGDYEKVSVVASGVAIDVYGNRHLVESLKPPVLDIGPPPPPPAGRRGRGPQNPLAVTMPQTVAAPDPLGRLKAVAEDVSSAVTFYSSLFGPPALKTLTVAPIPATFGQGFPGLVYLSTFAYLDPRERPAAMRDARQQVFFSDLLAAHETAHQWWGAVTTVDRSEDAWLLEGLANYSALLWLEKKRGFKDALSVLQGYRDELLVETAGNKTVESAGPIVWGDRLLASETAEAWRAVTYGRGVWVLHMLRRRLGDERFYSMLAEFRKRYEFRVATTEGFKALVQEFRGRVSAEAIDTFFDNWVYATGVPTLKLTYKIAGTAPNITVSGAVEQSGVDEDFSVDVPLEVQFAKGASQTIWVRTSTGEETFTEKLRQLPSKISLPDDMLLKH